MPVAQTSCRAKIKPQSVECGFMISPCDKSTGESADAKWRGERQKHGSQPGKIAMDPPNEVAILSIDTSFLKSRFRPTRGRSRHRKNLWGWQFSPQAFYRPDCQAPPGFPSRTAPAL